MPRFPCETVMIGTPPAVPLHALTEKQGAGAIGVIFIACIGIAYDNKSPGYLLIPFVVIAAMLVSEAVHKK